MSQFVDRCQNNDSDVFFFKVCTSMTGDWRVAETAISRVTRVPIAGYPAATITKRKQEPSNMNKGRKKAHERGDLMSDTATSAASQSSPQQCA